MPIMSIKLSGFNLEINNIRYELHKRPNLYKLTIKSVNFPFE